MTRRPAIPDSEGLAAAVEIQRLIHPAQVLLVGSRAVGEHRPDSDVDLMAICPDAATQSTADQALRQLLHGKYDLPVVNVITIASAEFHLKAPLAQSQAGQSARYGVTVHGQPFHYRPDREPSPEEIQQATTFWLRLAKRHLRGFTTTWESHKRLRMFYHPLDAQTTLERAIKALITARNDDTRFRRDAAIMWAHIETVHPIADRQGAQAMNNLIANTTTFDHPASSLTRFTQAVRQDNPMPDPTDREIQALDLYFRPAAEALIAEAMATARVTDEHVKNADLSKGIP